jgi:hypothetical protein
MKFYFLSKMFHANHLGTFFFTLAVLANCLSGQEMTSFRRHYIVLYDNSNPFVVQEEQNPQVLKTILRLFKNDIPLRIEGRTYNLAYERQTNVPFFDVKNDEISFYYFGLTQFSIEELFRENELHRYNRQFYAEFKNEFITPQNTNWSETRKIHRNDVAEYLNFVWRRYRPKWGFGYTLSNFVYPVALERITSEHYAEEYILIIISDFLSGSALGNRQDYRLIRPIFKNFSQEIQKKIDELYSKFYKIDYFEFSFPTGLSRNEQEVLLGIIGYKVRPNAGFYEPENVTIKIDSDLRLEQTGYRQSYYNLSEIMVNFLHNIETLKVFSVNLRIIGTGPRQKCIVLADTLLASYDERKSQLRCTNGEWVKLDTTRMNYTVPAFRARLKNFVSPDSLGVTALEVQYKFNSGYIIDQDSKLKITYTAGRTIPVEQVEFTSKTSVIIMYYTLPILAGLAVILGLICLGRPRGISLRFDGFVDNYEIIDYLHNRGRVRAPFKPWDSNRASVQVHGELTYTFPNYFFNWSAPFFLQLTDVQCPKGFDIFLTDGNQDYPREYDVKYEGRKKFVIRAVVVQSAGASAVREPLALEFEVGAGFAKGIFRAEFQQRWRYPFFIGPVLSEVWVGLDPGTTGSCIVSGTNVHNFVIQKEPNSSRDLITPSIIAFDIGKDYLPSMNGSINHESYAYGFQAQTVVGLRDRVSFQSIKKMLGFSNSQELRFKNNIPLRLDGKELTTLLVDGLLADHKKFIESSAQRHQDFLNGKVYNPERLVVAIPNNFTSTKIQALVDSINKLRRFKEVRYIYEAEAILLYYLYSKHRKVAFENETVLIFDMGGATINATVVNVRQLEEAGEKKFHVNIMAKLGYGVGGDTIDYCLIKLLYEFQDRYPQLARYNPFLSTTNMKDHEREEQLRLRKEFMQAAFKLKTRLIENFKNRDKDYLLNGFEISDVLKEMKNFPIDLAINEDDPLNKLLQKESGGKSPLFRHKLFKELIYDNVENATRDIVALAAGTPIQTVIFAGRSVLFPQIKKTVLKASGLTPTSVNFSEDELKSAVAKGACIYGVGRNSIVLQNMKTNGYFGVRRTRGPHEVEFLPLVEIGKPFTAIGDNRSVRGESAIADSFALDSHYLYFYQIMGHDPQRILAKQERHKYSLLNKIRVDNRTARIGMEVFENDDVSCLVEDNSHNIIERKAFVSDQEIADANDEHYTWIVH